MNKIVLDKTPLTEIRPEETIIPRYIPSYEELQQELDKYKNIVDELEKWLLEQLYIEAENLYKEEIIKIENPEIASILNKLKELKGSDR